MSLPFFGKHHRQEQVIPGKGYVPADRVREMAARGFSEPEMIDIMRREGFSADEVDKALTQALRIGVTGEANQPQQRFERPNQPIYQKQQPQQQQQFKWPSEQIQDQMQPQGQTQAEQMQQESEYELPTLSSIGAEQKRPQKQERSQTQGMDPNQMPQIPETSLPEGYYSQQYASEDYIDYVVQQRVTEITDKMGEYQKQYEGLQNKIDELKKQLAAKDSGPGIGQSQVMSKMDTFSDTITDIDSRLSGLEKAFKETLPELINSVRALSDLVQKVRKESTTSSI